MEKNFFEEKTSYETNPVESPADALRAFVDAYDVLQAVLAEIGGDDMFADELRAAIYRPVQPENENCPPISLYEIGVVYVPDGVGKYDINTRKMKAALRTREADVRALFVQDDGILPNLCEILPEFLLRELHEFTHASASRFLNECRRLFAMWS